MLEDISRINIIYIKRYIIYLEFMNQG